MAKSYPYSVMKPRPEQPVMLPPGWRVVFVNDGIEPLIEPAAAFVAVDTVDYLGGRETGREFSGWVIAQIEDGELYPVERGELVCVLRPEEPDSKAAEAFEEYLRREEWQETALAEAHAKKAAT